MLRLSVEGHNLSQCMDTRVGTAGGFYSKAFTCQRIYCFFNLLLDRGGVLLVLKPVVVRALVFDYERESNILASTIG